MLNKTQEQKIKNFIADETMSGAVKEVLRESFMKTNHNADVNILASQMMAITLLDDGFKELKRYSSKAEREEKDRKQVGL